MSKRSDRKRAEDLFASVLQTATGPRPATLGGDADHEEYERSGGHDDAPLTDDALAASPTLAGLVSVNRSRELPLMKKFRFQLLHRWIVDNVAPCRVADVGGGKGLLAFLLQQSGWPAPTVIDPVPQPLPTKYKDLATGRQVRVPETERVTRIDRPFEPSMAQDFDLIIALHAHGCNLQIINATADTNGTCRFLLLPCCVIGEPARPPVGVHWLQFVADYAADRGRAVLPFRLNFKGQNIGLYSV
jgi:hypothetical protein